MLETKTPPAQEPIGAQNGTPLSSRQVNRLIRSLKELSYHLFSLDHEVHDSIERILKDLCKEPVTVTFGGHFKSGKSSMLNAALGRLMLPVDDLPETGAICLLRSGERDSAEVYNRRGRRRIDCNTTAIQRETSLISQVGERRTEVQQVDRVEIMLSACTIPQQACWIDSPGINDTPAMTERARRAAWLADILVWVLSSKQLMSEPEVEFLANYIAERGPAAVVFVINAFLPEDTEKEWREFQAQRLPRHMNKIRDQAAIIGFGRGAMPEVLVVSARAFGKTGGNGFGNGFGSAELHSLLDSLTSPESGRVQRARIYRAALELRKLATQVETKLKKEAANVAKVRQALVEKRAEAERKRKQFEGDVKRAVDAFLEDWTTRTRNCGVSIANTISTDSLLRDGTYSQSLTASLQAAGQEAYKTLQQEIRARARFYEQMPLSTRHTEELGNLLTSPVAEVVVPDNSISGGGLAASAATGAAAGTLFAPGIGTLIGAVGGFFFGLAGGAKEAMTKDVEAAKANVQQAAEQAAAALRKRRQKVIAFILRHCTVDEQSQLGAQPDETCVRQWESILQSVQRAADQASELT